MFKPYDSSTKFLVEAYPADWLALAGFEAVERVAAVDSNLSTITAEADKVLRVEGPEPWLAHIELQSGREAHLPRRLLRYNALLDDRHGLPTRSILVLLGKQADGGDLSGIYRRSFPGEPHYLEFHYQVVRAWQQPVESVLRGGLGTLPMAPVAHLGGMGKKEVIRRMREKLDREPIEEAGKLWNAAALLTGLLCSREEVAKLFRGIPGMKESSFYQMIVEEGEAKGKIEEARRILLRQGTRRFGPPDQTMVASIESIGQTERIEEWLDRLLDASSWEELLADMPDSA